MIKVIMLGWEYPPHITGGLGTACEGLTKALSKHGLTIQFVIPKVFGDEKTSHMKLLEPAIDGLTINLNNIITTGISRNQIQKSSLSEVEIPAFLTPYLNARQYQTKWQMATEEEIQIHMKNLSEFLKMTGIPSNVRTEIHHYGTDLFDEVERFSQRVLLWANAYAKFDLIHAHDWMTFSAGVLLKEMTACPLIVHVHSLENDRSGEHGNPRIIALEALGLTRADRIIAVSEFTKRRIQEIYHIPEHKISVVHNGMNPNGMGSIPKKSKLSKGKARKSVLFLGRITFQKGPDYFVEAAKKVIPEIPDIVFVMAGAGDMLPAIKEQVHRSGLDQYFEFPGFLRKQEVAKAYAAADLYVMPSVSEPFGIAPLEAIAANTPVLISRQSGVSEVLSHALKADFWDIDELADLIIGVLKYPELKRDLLKMAQEEVRRITWESAAQKTIENYFHVLMR